MKFQGALVKEQGVTFAIVIVKKTIIDNRMEAEKAIQSFQTFFPGVPLVLMAQNFSGVPSYFGRPDIVKFLSNVPLAAIPWQEYTVN